MQHSPSCLFPKITHTNNEVLGRGPTSCEETWEILPRQEESNTSVLLSPSHEELYQFNLERKKKSNTENNPKRQLSVIPQKQQHEVRLRH